MSRYMHQKNMLSSNIMLLCTALIWGLTFSAQKVGMRFIGPLLFNGLRFLLGGLILIPLFFFRKRYHRSTSTPVRAEPFFLQLDRIVKTPFTAGLVAGLALFFGSTLQQIGLVQTTAGNAGFITGLYIIIVPMLEMAFGKRLHSLSWLAVLLAISGFFLLSVMEDFVIVLGDAYVLAGVFFWAIHVLITSHIAARFDPIHVAIIQYMFCSCFSFLFAFFFESILLSSIVYAFWAIAYSAVISIALAFTLQIFGQKHAHPSHAALILSLEGVFAVLGGVFFLGEILTGRHLAAMTLMILALLLSQLGQLRLQIKTPDAV